jgi:type II secretory pathway pseudopilin PulG
MRRREDGYSLVALMVAVAVMLVLMTAAVPSWRYLMKNDREEELIFRGGEIADAIARYQRRNGNALPPSIDALVKGHFLRRAYKDPMTKDGKWRLIRPGEAIGPVPGAAGAGRGKGAGAGTSPATSGTGKSGTGTAGTGTSGSAASSSASTRGLGGGTTIGGFQGVASTSTEKSLRVFNGRTRYSEWLFVPGQPRVVGRPAGPAAPQPGGGVRPPGTSGSLTRP